MSDAKQRPVARTIEKQVEIVAPVEAVWKMLTDPEELVRWFPLEARVEPGEGGNISLSWGPECEGTAPISVWKPNKWKASKTISAREIDTHYRPQPARNGLAALNSSFRHGVFA